MADIPAEHGETVHLRSGGYDQINALDNFRPSCLRKAGEHQCHGYIEWQQAILEIGDEAVAQCEKLIGSRTFALAHELQNARFYFCEGYRAQEQQWIVLAHPLEDWCSFICATRIE